MSEAATAKDMFSSGDRKLKRRDFPRSATRVISAQNLILTRKHSDFRAFGRTRGA